MALAVLPRGQLYGSGAAHAEPAPGPRRPRLHHQARGRPGDLRRQRPPGAAGQGRHGRARPRGALCLLRRRRRARGLATAGGRARGPREGLRGLPERGPAELRVARAARDGPARPLLHLGHDRRAQGRGLQPALDLLAHARERGRGPAGAERLASHPAVCAHVPRPELGAAVLLPYGRRSHGLQRTLHGSRQPAGLHARLGRAAQHGGANSLAGRSCCN
mmetsp:Transcript_39916/g.114027  ORF Transcript_39916/g.114027 Transcript_39916/m.114027 type:complete len:219 (+) Transcript_39916:294-950(+)